MQIFSHKQPSIFVKAVSLVLKKPLKIVFTFLYFALFTVNCSFKSYPAHHSRHPVGSIRACQNLTAFLAGNVHSLLNLLLWFSFLLIFIILYFIPSACNVLFHTVSCQTPLHLLLLVQLFFCLPFHLSVPIYYSNINNGAFCCCRPSDVAASASVVSLVGFILTYLLLAVL